MSADTDQPLRFADSRSRPAISVGTVVVRFVRPASGNNTYAAVIVTESEIEMPTVHGGDGNMNPRIFQLGLLANLTGQYAGVYFNAVITKAYAYAHAVVGVQRP
jgi:hypothetical protein